MFTEIDPSSKHEGQDKVKMLLIIFIILKIKYFQRKEKFYKIKAG